MLFRGITGLDTGPETGPVSMAGPVPRGTAVPPGHVQYT